MSQNFQTPIHIAGTGHALPKKMVSSQELDVEHGLERGYLEQISGVQTRYVCDGEDQIDLAVTAANLAIKNAGITADSIDLVLGACGIPYQTLPATAPLVMGRLGISDGNAAAFDVNATCLSFLSAFDLAAAKIATGQSNTALIFSSEIASRALPWQQQPDVAALFGDGAAAVVLTKGDGKSGRIHASLMRSYPTAYNACSIGAGGTKIDFQRDPELFARNAHFHMEGKELFRITHQHFPAFIDDLLENAGWERDDIDLVIPHQASPLGLAHMVRKAGLNPARVVNVAARLGNQIAASIPTALDIAWGEGRIPRGSKLLLLGTSAGVSFGGMAIEA